ncbi:MAG: molybdopterin molybdotransferase MoeA [Rhodospirillaceae bacterium]|jgi:molybdopterin molybdotransferase|nr:molybdopterin molybdotransferase MoeA [Rhodospirillaceae bacterium]MBT5014721.1 molybdopterin molybdotransferase MoeA [Rhodospirillaceae bacterium]MBT6406964.1 molybdopterin molybdotransferase MoeA [Rhodospirillaceae bacterium]MBT7354977.1 molybdopterin molybdotransferase MoeA [Rhodospirillaceae bacterium]
MTQLKDDCFASGDELMGLDTALQRLSDSLDAVVDVETIALTEGVGRILARDQIAGRDVPAHDNSAVDGYAVWFDDLTPGGETRLQVTGRITAGHPLDRAPRPGECLRIFTGAAMPTSPDGGPDTVFMQEDVEVDGDHVILPDGLTQGSNRRFRGEDIKTGTTILNAGQRLRPQEVGLAASVGIDALPVYKRLSVAVFSTGDEIRDPSDEAPEGCVFDANRFSVMGLLSRLGCDVTDLGILPDNLDSITDALKGASAKHDLLITSGGVSVGDEDHVKPAVESLGRLDFWRLAIKPGRPIALGTINGGNVSDTVFVGLPGNPVAAMVTFMRVVAPVVKLLSGEPIRPPHLFGVTAAFTHKKKSGRREWVRCRLEVADDGTLKAVKHPSGGAGVLSSMVFSDGLVELPEDQTDVKEGEQVQFLPFTEVCP